MVVETELRPERAEHRALVEAFAHDAITRVVEGETWSHTLAEQLRTVAAAHEGTTTGTLARDAGQDLQLGLAAAPDGDAGESGSSAT